MDLFHFARPAYPTGFLESRSGFWGFYAYAIFVHHNYPFYMRPGLNSNFGLGKRYFTYVDLLRDLIFRLCIKYVLHVADD